MDNIQVLDSLFKKPATSPTDRDQLILIVDKSGSMSTIRSDAEGSINSFISDQKKLDRGADLLLVEFDEKFEPQANIDITQFGQYSLTPRGYTALYDAIGMTVSGYNQVAGIGKVIVVIVTDGQENASTEYTKLSVRALIESRQAAGWEFVFLGASQDTFEEAQSIGISADSVVMYASSGQGYADAQIASSNYVGTLRSASKQDAVNGLMTAKLNSTTLK